MTDISSINLDKLRNIVQKFQHSDFTAAQVASDYWEGEADQVAASRDQFESLLQRTATRLGIREVGATSPVRWHAAL